MYAKTITCSLVSLVALAQAQSVAQGPAPAPVRLSTTKSGVLPVIPTQTTYVGYVDTIEGAIVNPGVVNPGFTGLLGDAVIQQNKPGLSFKAVLPNTNFNNYTGSTITGTVTGTVPANGTGVLFTVNLSGLPNQAQYGPFGYHVHNLPVPADGNCTSTLAHLDPTNRGEYYPCDATQPQTCQAGTLAGKHGKIMTGPTFNTSYLELYLSTDPASPYYFGDKSIVFHSSNTTRLTCANFVAVPSASNSTASPSAATPPSATYTGSASQLTLSAALLSAVFAAVSFLI